MPIVPFKDFVALAKLRREELGLNLRNLANILGISASELSNIERRIKQPDKLTLIRLITWVEMPADRALEIRKPEDLGPIYYSPEATPEIVEAHLRADKNLTPETAKAMSTLFEVAYSNFHRPSNVPHEVLLGASAPKTVKRGSEFTARFAAYMDSLQKEIESYLLGTSPRTVIRTLVPNCTWQKGTKVKVHCYGDGLEIQTPEECFEWSGDCNFVDFDIKVAPKSPDMSTLLKLDIRIGGFFIAGIRLYIKIRSKTRATKRAAVKVKPVKTAFASYAKKDRLRVLDRVSEIQRNGVDVFLDCLSLSPGDKWKSALEREIILRESFLLFWSAEARKSKWVDWEWRTAYKHKGIDGIDPHPLDPVADAKPPKELSDLHFGDPYNILRKAYDGD